MIFSICIATYKRPELLKKLINSLVIQTLPEATKLEILVVDNSVQREAELIIKRFSRQFPDLFCYLIQKEKNISLTRNMAVKKAKGEYLFFIDDDEYAESNWLMSLYYTLLKFNADAVFGKVISYFDEGTLEWIKKSYIYNRPSPPTGTIAKATRTGNCVVRASLLKKTNGPFDPKYGISGGSDTHLFETLRIQGAKYVNCEEAITYEYVPKERSTQRWLFKRAFRGGNDFTRHAVELATRKSKFIVCLKHFLLGLVYLIVSFLLIVFLFPIKSWRMHWRLKMIANIGKISAIIGYLPKEYA
jgi:succinoglycan biosynthesis protein ExoM